MVNYSMWKLHDVSLMVGYSPVVATTADVIGSFIVTNLALGLWGGVPKLDESP